MAQGFALKEITSSYLANLCNGRLTLTSGTPVTTSDVTAATTIYFTPYKGHKVGLYNTTTSKWELFTLTEKSIAVPATTDTGYDVFMYNNSGTLTLELVSWTNLTTRATALTTQDGIRVKSGDASRRFLGSFQTGGTSGQTEFSDANRYIWNLYNQVTFRMKAVESTGSWTYTTQAWRQMNNSSSNQLNFFIGLSTDIVKANTKTLGYYPTYNFMSGIGLDSTTVNSAIVTPWSVPNGDCAISAIYEGYPGIGHHYLAALETLNQSGGSGTCYFYGTNGYPNNTAQAGILGFLKA